MIVPEQLQRGEDINIDLMKFFDNLDIDIETKTDDSSITHKKAYRKKTLKNGIIACNKESIQRVGDYNSYTQHEMYLRNVDGGYSGYNVKNVGDIKGFNIEPGDSVVRYKIIDNNNEKQEITIANYPTRTEDAIEKPNYTKNPFNNIKEKKEYEERLKKDKEKHAKSYETNRFILTYEEIEQII